MNGERDVRLPDSSLAAQLVSGWRTIGAVALGALIFTTGPLYRVRTWWSYDDPLSADIVVIVVQVAVLAALAALVVRGRYWKRVAPTVGIAALAFTGWLLATALWSVDAATTVRESLLLALALLVGGGAAAAIRERDLLVGAWIGVHLGLAWSAVGILTLAPGTQDFASDWTGVFFNSNSLALVAAIGLLLSFVCWFTPGLGRWTVWIKLATVGAGLADMWLIRGSGALTPLFAVASALVMVAAAMVARRFVRRDGAGGIGAQQLAAVGGLAVLIAGALAWTVRAEWLPLIGQTADLTGRTALWEVSIDWWTRRPGVGHGYLALWSDPEFLVDIEAVRGKVLTSAHSSFIDVLLGAGLVGLTGLLMIVALGWMGTATRALTTRTAFGLWPLGAFTFWMVENLTETIFVSGQFAPVLLGATVVAATSRPTSTGDTDPESSPTDRDTASATTTSTA